jgi:hypothetical protein
MSRQDVGLLSSQEAFFCIVLCICVIRSADMKVPIEDASCMAYAMSTAASVNSISKEASKTVA